MTDSAEPQYFAAVCPAVHRPFLALLVGPDGQALSPRCVTCSAPALVISGPSYAAADHVRFERIVDAALQHRIAPENMRSALAVLDRLVRRPEADVYRELLSVLNVTFVQPLKPEDGEDLIAFASILSGLLSLQSEPTPPAESTARRIAGTSVHDSVPPDDAKTGS